MDEEIAQRLDGIKHELQQVDQKLNIVWECSTRLVKVSEDLQALTKAIQESQERQTTREVPRFKPVMEEESIPKEIPELEPPQQKPGLELLRGTQPKQPISKKTIPLARSL